MKKIVKTDNKGYTLVELIVAIGILAIVVAPLLQGFVTSAKTNTKARKLLAATTVAENLMEEMKIQGFNQIQEEEKTNITKTETDGIYTWTKESIVLDGKTYHAKVTVDPSTYSGEVTSNQKNNHNDVELVNIYDMDTRQDAIYVESAADREKVISEYRASLNDQVISTEDLEKNLSHTIKVTITATGDLNGDYSAKVKLSSEYSAGSQFSYVKPQDYTIYDSSQAQGNLRGIYLLYTPIYGSGGAANDSIVIYNEQQVPVNVYIIKQKKSDELLSFKEDGYYVDVTVNESATSNPSTPREQSIAATKVFSNINWNLDNIEEKLTRKQGRFQYKGPNNILVTGEEAEKMISLAGLGALSSQERLYKATISIYDNQGEDVFTEENCLVTIDGTIQK